jgi:putative iron-regulated protein
MLTAGTSVAQQTNKAILHTYANIAADSYQAALIDAKALKNSLQTLAATPNTSTLQAAKDAWLQARESYGITEIFRLSNGPIDAEQGWVADTYGALEGQINAWPLDENMIDYTVAADGTVTRGNIIATKGMFHPGGTAVDVTTITAKALTALNENGGDANVASGYHAIEFLLWGQDQDYDNFLADTITNGALIAGQRPLTDFTKDPLAVRRLQYLTAAADKLIADLTIVTHAWHNNTGFNGCTEATGCYRSALLGELRGADASKNIADSDALRTIITGMGLFIKSELANERIAVAVLTPSEEDEHSCFSDNTHRDIALNYQGFINILKGELNGKKMGVSMYEHTSDTTRQQLDSLITAIDARVHVMNQLATTRMHFDYQIMDPNQSEELRRMKNDMRKLGDAMTAVAADLAISLTIDDVTDPEETKLL